MQVAKPDPLAPWQVLISSLDVFSWLGTLLVFFLSVVLMVAYYGLVDAWRKRAETGEEADHGGGGEGVVSVLLTNLAFLLGVSFQEAMDKIQ